MNIKRLASMIATCTLILSACTLVKPTMPAVPTTSPLESPVTPEQAPGTTDVAPGTTVTDTNTTPEVTATEVITLGVDVSASTEVTPTEVTTPTTEAEATAVETPTEEIGTMGTDVTSVVVRVRTLNVRSGPGTGYPVVYRLTLRRTANVVGISTDNQWYLIECKAGVEGECWISAGARYVTTRK